MEYVNDPKQYPDLRVNIGSLVLQNPVMTASGTFGYAREFESLVNLHRLGAVIVKGISLHPRRGNPPQRIVETPCGMLNAIGLQNVGVERFISEKMPYLRNLAVPVIVNILGDTVEEYREITERLALIEGIAALEVNISCPNVKRGGVAFGTDPQMARKVTEAVKEVAAVPVMVKLSPNVSDIVAMARAVEDGGADSVSLINTLIGMAIDLKRRRPVLANVIGGLSGPAIKPVALRMVYQVAGAVAIPVIGIGGIDSAEDALEFILAGATAVQIGTANFINPRISEEVVEGIGAYVQDHDLQSIRELIGALEV
ncbi:dihydroorotate dehydrogenase [Desulfofustis limnaeus]|jgi:dihydroorotate dehydrogenase (NAD+) catalytic subunit|uniref:Dihydroorotate dehydrogenase n=1 Tax=Desulfofustis limnaeus TaxID=2740163 RepID=A0ABM7WAU1_9BACT|nr:dihydroorotate dehydrogenase [Desulfofustis limnaeus]MDX9894854.1 dihydroorotate dehydrogenase [Desulfofustis sp.]BDD88026.1 dihydroorotate dehydrogenase B (NAD(+)), catalytic subunit [Desulfofustis limnaeus]